MLLGRRLQQLYDIMACYVQKMILQKFLSWLLYFEQNLEVKHFYKMSLNKRQYLL